MGDQGREGLGRGAFALVSLREFQQFGANPAAVGAGDASRFGSKALSPELEPSLTKLENRFQVFLGFFRGWIVVPIALQGHPGLVVPDPPPSLWGGGSERYWVPIPCLLGKFSKIPHRPSHAPAPRAPSAVFRGSPQLHLELRVRNPLGPTLFCTTSLSLSGS